jgi:serine/threonine protein kinase/tetratricopeptide (TPR) repeat protein
MIGRTIAHYTILEKLGEGGMGVVYKAHDTKLDRTVALKFLPAHLSASEDDKKRFLQEARAAASLTHPNICTIFAIEEFTEQGGTGSQFFFAMEYVEGKTLRHAMKDVTLQRALDIGMQVAEGLAAAHDKGIVHRDVKAENIMVRPDGRAQIMDFGLAKVRGGSALTKAGSTVGTIGYMSPEQIQGMDADNRADIFSLGVLLYEMAAGRLPFRGVHDAAIMYEIVNVQPPPPSEVKPGLPGELDRIIMKCLAKECEERYQSARDIAVDIRILKKQSGSGVSTAVPGVAGAQRGSSGSRAAVPQAAPPSSGGVESTSSDEAQPGSSRITPVVPAQQGSGPVALTNRKPAIYIIAAVVLLAALAGAWYFSGGGSSSTINSMVVLPFENVGNNPDLEYLSDGVTEGIINKVSGIPNLRVIPRSASFRFKGSTKDPKTIGEELGVDAVLSGRVVQRGDRLDITLELIDVRQYSQMWGETYRRTMNDLMSVQDEIVGSVTEKIRPGGSAAPEHAERAETKNPDAYRLYLQGKFYWNKRTAPDLERALGYYGQAIALDPDFARAHLGMAETYLLQGQYSDKRSTDILARAESEALRSLELDNNLGEAHAALGMIREGYWDWPGAEREFKLAIEKAPGYATSYHWYWIYLQIMGRGEEGAPIMRKGAELDPFSPIILVNYAEAFLRNDDYAGADEILRKVLEIDPQFFFANLWHASVLQGTGKTREALEVLNRIQLEGLSTNGLGFMGYYYSSLGDRAKAETVLAMLMADSTRQQPDPVAVAMVYCGMGDVESSIRWLQKAYDPENKSRTLPNTRAWREFRLVWKDPRYIALMKKVGIM